MTTRTNYMTMFENVAMKMANEAIQHERGLGAEFGDCVKQLLNDNPKSSDEELVVLYNKAVTHMEDHVRSKIVDAFDDDKCTLSKASPLFVQYKSRYRAFLERMGNKAREMTSFGPSAVAKAVAEDKATKRKASEPTPDNKGPGTTATTDSKGGSSNDGKQLDPKVRAKIENALLALTKMDTEQALRIAVNFDNASWAALKNGSRKLSTVTKSAAVA